MQIHELNTKALTDPAYVAFDDGTDTYKADFKEVIDDAVAEAFSSADVSGGVVNYTSGDSSSPSSWASVSVMSSGSTLATLMNRISTMVKNVRYLWSLIGSSSITNVSSTITEAIGNTSISGIGDGTLTGAISSLNSKIDYWSLGSDAGIDTITPTLTTHILYNGRKFSDYKFICAIIEDNYRRAFTMVPANTFKDVAALPISLSYVDSSNAQYWVEIRYVSNTSYSIIGSSNTNGKKLRLFGLLQ